MNTIQNISNERYQDYRELAADAWSQRHELKSLSRRVKADEELTRDQREELGLLLARRVRVLTDALLDD